MTALPLNPTQHSGLPPLPQQDADAYRDLPAAVLAAQDKMFALDARLVDALDAAGEADMAVQAAKRRVKATRAAALIADPSSDPKPDKTVPSAERALAAANTEADACQTAFNQARNAAHASVMQVDTKALAEALWLRADQALVESQRLKGEFAGQFIRANSLLRTAERWYAHPFQVEPSVPSVTDSEVRQRLDAMDPSKQPERSDFATGEPIN